MVRSGSNASVQLSRHVGFTPDFGRIAARQQTDASGHNQTHAPQQIRERLCGAFNPHIDFAAERPKVDWFGQQRLSTVLQSLPLGLRVAIGGNHDDGDVRS